MRILEVKKSTEPATISDFHYSDHKLVRVSSEGIHYMMEKDVDGDYFWANVSNTHMYAGGKFPTSKAAVEHAAKKDSTVYLFEGAEILSAIKQLIKEKK